MAGRIAGRAPSAQVGRARAASPVAVGMLGALLGGLAATWADHRLGSLPAPLPDLLAAALGAVVGLALWMLARRRLHGAAKRPRS